MRWPWTKVQEAEERPYRFNLRNDEELDWLWIELKHHTWSYLGEEGNAIRARVGRLMPDPTENPEWPEILTRHQKHANQLVRKFTA